MKHTVLTALVLASAVSASAGARIKLATVPAEYRPNTGPEHVEPVSMQGFHFEINKETSSVRVVVDYTYRHELYYQSDGDAGPRPTAAQLAGLTYDPSSHAIVYDRQGRRTVCAVVRERTNLFGTHFEIENTGACRVTAIVRDHAES